MEKKEVKKWQDGAFKRYQMIAPDMDEGKRPSGKSRAAFLCGLCKGAEQLLAEARA